MTNWLEKPILNMWGRKCLKGQVGYQKSDILWTRHVFLTYSTLSYSPMLIIIYWIGPVLTTLFWNLLNWNLRQLSDWWHLKGNMSIPSPCFLNWKCCLLRTWLDTNKATSYGKFAMDSLSLQFPTYLQRTLTTIYGLIYPIQNLILLKINWSTCVPNIGILYLSS